MAEVLPSTGSPQDEQARFLQESSNSVKRSGFYMKRALDDDNLREALRFSAAMLGELRTSFLTPQKYFELYMQVFDELRYLESFFKEEQKKGRSYADLYELVQHAGNVLPRLYLLCTVGSCFIRSKEAPAKDILKDLVEMCKGVQHPTRGLFLRSYLCQVSRGLLPDVGSEFEGEGGDIDDALDFLLLNFTEMNKLWVRMQHQGSNRDKERREKERQQLADLVGKNLTYISQLEGLDFPLYKELVQPRIMEQVVACKDDIAQQYLMQCVIQGFPDDFHLGTLDTLLGTLPQLQPGVKVHVVLSSLLDRLARYASSDAAILDTFNEADAFGKLMAAASEVATQQTEMPAADVTAMFIALAGFTGTVYPDKLPFVDAVLTTCFKALEARSAAIDARAEKQLSSLLTIPLDAYDVVMVLSLSNYTNLMNLLPPQTRKDIATKIVQTILKQGTNVGSLEKVDMLFDFIAPLVQSSEAEEEAEDDEDLTEEQGLVARLIHQLHSDDTDEAYVVLRSARERLTQSDAKRLRHTLPSLAFKALGLVPSIRSREEAGEELETSCKTVLQFVHGVAAQLADLGLPGTAELALQLFLTATYSSSELAGLELITYEFFEQAFVIYEENIPNSNAERTALHSIVGALQRCTVLSPESRDTLVHKATGYSAKLLKKADQCRAVCACSHLFWQAEAQAPPVGEETASSEQEEQSTGRERAQPPVRAPEPVMTCLKRALKIAHAAQQQLAVAMKTKDTTPVLLFVEILNHYIYYFEQGLPTITASVLQNLLELVSNEISSDHCQGDVALMAFYNNTVSHIRAQKDKDGATASRYKEVGL